MHSCRAVTSLNLATGDQRVPLSLPILSDVIPCITV
jgi:hypothetical protein